MHHPACWVRNEGCVTLADHRRNPIAQAYGLARPSAAAAPHPGEGTRRAAAWSPPAEPGQEDDGGEAVRPAGPVPFAARGAPLAPGAAPRFAGPVIGEPSEQQPMVRHINPPIEAPGRSHAPRRYQPPGDGAPGHAPLPRLYGRHPVLGYWFVPAAAIVAVLVAVGVVWAGDRIFGGTDDPAEQAVVTTPAPPSPTIPGGFSTPSPAAAGSVTPSTPSIAVPTAAPQTGKFRPNDIAVVTGAGDCLNVRTAAGLANPAIVCLQDTTEVTVKGGPERVDDLTWWKVQTKLGEGWAAEDYLVKK